MTLIAAFHCGRMVAALSDLLVTQTGNSHLAEARTLPIVALRDYRTHTHATTISQKSLLIGSLGFLFAGSAAKAKSIARLLALLVPATAELAQEIIQAHFRAMPSDYSHDVSIICIENSPKGMRMLGINTPKVRDLGDYRVISGGTGWEEVDWPARSKSSAPHQIPLAFNALSSHLADLIHKELSDPNHLTEKFGGGYEIITPKRTGGFQKESYLLDQFSLNPDGKLGWESRTYFRYFGSELIIMMLCALPEDFGQYAVGSLALSCPSLLARPTPGQELPQDFLHSQDLMTFRHVSTHDRRQSLMFGGETRAVGEESELLQFTLKNGVMTTTVSERYLKWCDDVSLRLREATKRARRKVRRKVRRKTS